MFFGGGLIPGFLNLKMLGLYNTFWVYVIPGIFGFFSVIMLMSYFNDIPDAMEESAHIDGANYFRIFWSIYLPMSMPIIATLLLFAGVGQWNSYFDSFYFVRKESLQTLAAALLKIVLRNEMDQFTRELSRSLQTETRQVNIEGIKLAIIVVSIVPVLLIYPFMQRFFIKGVRIGAIKG